MRRIVFIAAFASFAGAAAAAEIGLDTDNFQYTNIVMEHGLVFVDTNLMSKDGDTATIVTAEWEQPGWPYHMFTLKIVVDCKANTSSFGDMQVFDDKGAVIKTDTRRTDQSPIRKGSMTDGMAAMACHEIKSIQNAPHFTGRAAVEAFVKDHYMQKQGSGG